MTEDQYLEQFRVTTRGRHAVSDDDGTPEYALIMAAQCMRGQDYSMATAWAAMATARQTLLNANVQHFDKY